MSHRPTQRSDKFLYLRSWRAHRISISQYNRLITGGLKLMGEIRDGETAFEVETVRENNYPVNNLLVVKGIGWMRSVY